MSTDRLRETDALPLTPEEVSQYKKWTTLGPNFSLSTHEQRRLLATIDARDAEIERLSKIEERAKDVTGLPAGTGEYSPTRLRSETAQYILEGDLHTQTTKGDT